MKVRGVGAALSNRAGAGERGGGRTPQQYMASGWADDKDDDDWDDWSARPPVKKSSNSRIMANGGNTNGKLERSSSGGVGAGWDDDWGDGWSGNANGGGPNGKTNKYAMGPGSMVGFGPRRQNFYTRFRKQIIAAVALFMGAVLLYSGRSGAGARSEPAHYTEVRIDDPEPAADLAAAGGVKAHAHKRGSSAAAVPFSKTSHKLTPSKSSYDDADLEEDHESTLEDEEPARNGEIDRMDLPEDLAAAGGVKAHAHKRGSSAAAVPFSKTSHKLAPSKSSYDDAALEEEEDAKPILPSDDAEELPADDRLDDATVDEVDHADHESTLEDEEPARNGEIDRMDLPEEGGEVLNDELAADAGAEEHEAAAESIEDVTDDLEAAESHEAKAESHEEELEHDMEDTLPAEKGSAEGLDSIPAADQKVAIEEDELHHDSEEPEHKDDEEADVKETKAAPEKLAEETVPEDHDDHVVSDVKSDVVHHDDEEAHDEASEAAAEHDDETKPEAVKPSAEGLDSIPAADQKVAMEEDELHHDSESEELHHVSEELHHDLEEPEHKDDEEADVKETKAAPEKLAEETVPEDHDDHVVSDVKSDVVHHDDEEARDEASEAAAEHDDETKPEAVKPSAEGLDSIPAADQKAPIEEDELHHDSEELHHDPEEPEHKDDEEAGVKETKAAPEKLAEETVPEDHDDHVVSDVKSDVVHHDDEEARDEASEAAAEHDDETKPEAVKPSAEGLDSIPAADQKAPIEEDELHHDSEELHHDPEEPEHKDDEEAGVKETKAAPEKQSPGSSKKVPRKMGKIEPGKAKLHVKGGHSVSH
ncbi:hypothetical protein RI054_12g63010 [Pseudoscourfieldia marina]